MRILLTGGGGMLGQELAGLLSPQHEVLAPSHAECDITDEAAVERYWIRSKPELAINCAAMSDVDGCERDPQRGMAVNALGPGYLARTAERAGTRLIHISTDYVFDGSANRPYTEQDAPAPVSEYGRSKLEGERRVIENPASLHLIVRTAWLYGQYRPSFVDKLVESARAERPITAVEDQVSCPTWTLPLAERIVALAVSTPDARGILHLAGAGQCSRYQMARYIVGKLSASVPVNATTWEQLRVPARRPRYSVMASSRLREFGISALPDWKVSLDAYLRARFALHPKN